MPSVAIIGGGAAGFFAAIACAQHHPQLSVHLYEKTSKLLAKVKISGGGRCNVTHACFDIPQFAQNYPRGSKQLKRAFKTFSASDTVEWFERRGVPLKAEADGRMFPVSDNSQSVIDCLLQEAHKHRVAIHLQTGIQALQLQGEQWAVQTTKGETILHDAVIVATGGSPKLQGLQWLAELGHRIEAPLPSLFTFNFPKDPVLQLMGVAVPTAKVSLQGTKFTYTGPLLVTHWGMSGPAVLKLSAFAARWIAAQHYQFGVRVGWLAHVHEEEVRQRFLHWRQAGHKKQLGNVSDFELPQRLWHFLLAKALIPKEKRLVDLSNKDINRLVQLLVNDAYQASGKTTFKDEFVTTGGVDLRDVDFKTMESKKCPGLFFAGEVMDIDGITGGFNFQSAWTTGFIAGQSAGKVAAAARCQA